MKQKDNLYLIIHKFDAPEDGLIRRRFLQFSSGAKMEFTEFSEFDLDTMRKIETRIHIDRTNFFEELKDALNEDDAPLSNEASKRLYQRIEKAVKEKTLILIVPVSTTANDIMLQPS